MPRWRGHSWNPRAAAASVISLHSTFGRPSLADDPAADIVFGRVDYDGILNSIPFAPTTILPDAVRVTVRSTHDSPNGSAGLFFSALFGKSIADVDAAAAAGLTGARDDAHPVIVLMSDGANRKGPNPLVVAQQAVNLGIRIYTVSVGFKADRVLMQQIADMSGGREFYAAGTPEEYTPQLQVIFQTIGGLGVATLIE